MKKTNISIGIPVYNEEKNIHKLIMSIKEQKQEKFNIKEIIFVLDGCEDKTLSKIVKNKNKYMKIIVHSKRKGKSTRLNEIFNLFKGDYLILLDADIILDGKSALETIIKVLQSNRKVGLVGGKANPAKPTTFIEKSINSSLKAYYNFLETINKGNNILACKGVFLGLSRNFAKSLNIPPGVFGNDTYMFLSCISKGLIFKYTKDAGVLINLPKTISDQVNQNKRFVGAKFEMEKYFGNLVEEEFSSNRFILYKYLLQELLSNPLECLTVYFINLYTKIYIRFNLKRINPIWISIKSTKEGTI